MNKVKREAIDYCSEKMMIKLSEQEIETITKEIEELNNDFDNIVSEFPDLESAEKMTHTIDIPDIILRADEPIESSKIEDLLKNAVHVTEGQIEVPKVVG